MDHRIPVLLDTDPGSDIDDAVALAYLLRQPRCELVGVTTVSGDVAKRAAIVEVVCRAAGREDVPIVCGRSNPLAVGPGQPNVPHYGAIAHLAHRQDRHPNEAVDFLRSTIRARPGEITLLTIGPYSNAAILFALDPDIPSLLGGLFSMGGYFFDAPYTEWNAKVDPLATAITYAAPRNRHVSVGLDVTLKCQMSSSEVETRFVGEPLSTVAQMATKWFEHTGELTFHDPLTAALIFRPKLCRYRTGQVLVDPMTGATTLQEGTGPDVVASEVDVPAFFAEYFSVLGV